MSVVKELQVTQPYVNKKQGIFWTPELRASKQKSIDIHNVWKSLGRPRNGTINEERLRVKCQYKNAIVECRKEAELYKKQNFIYKLASNGSKGFWKGFKALKRCTNVNSCHNVSGKSDNNDICEGFKNYYIDNFVDSWNNKSFCDKLKNSEYDLLQTFMVSNCSVFSAVEELGAVSNLCLGKVCGFDSLYMQKPLNTVIPVLYLYYSFFLMHVVSMVLFEKFL